MSFTRRFESFPSSQVIGQIEGVVIVDQPAPSSIQGVSTGVVGVIGEFADMKYAVSVNGNGEVSTKLQPVEVTSAQDLLNKVGGWDATLGDFGGDDGNGYFTVYGKRFSRLILCPVNLASSKGVRLWRELPTNKSASAATPIGAGVQAVTIPAGTEFRNTAGTTLVRLGTAVTFTSTPAYLTGTDAHLTLTSTEFTGTLESVSADFVAAGVKVGDAVVVGVLPSSGAGTYRVTEVTDENTLKIQKQDGTAFASIVDSSYLPWRLHEAATADSGGEYVASSVSGYSIPARPTKVNGSDSVADTIPQGTDLPATNPAADGTASQWFPTSGLTMGIMRGGSGGLAFDPDTQKANVSTTAAMDALYSTALDALLADSDPVREISILVTSRTSDTIRTLTKQHVLQSSATGKGRMACIAPPINEIDEASVLGSTYVGANRDERVVFCWPGVQQFVEPAVRTRVKTAAGTFAIDGNLDVRSDIFMASVLSNLASERNPGQSTDPVPLCLAPILAFQRGNLPSFSMTDYILFKQNGVCSIRFDRTSGKIFQSGVTSSLESSKKNINRRRMADEIQDSLAAAYSSYIKQPLTSQLKSSVNSETSAYLTGLLSPNNPAAQRIEAFQVDTVSGNTPQLAAQGIHVVIVKVKMLATADSIVLQAEVGQTVNITTT